jgi:hypothetical protein
MLPDRSREARFVDERNAAAMDAFGGKPGTDSVR